jgi:hypothetical protein
VAERTVIFTSRRLRSAELVGAQDGAGERSNIVLCMPVHLDRSRSANRSEGDIALIARAET